MTIFVTPELYDDDATRYRAKRSDLLNLEDEYLIIEALHKLLEVKQEARAVVNASLDGNTRSLGHFSESDFGIPQIRRLLTKLGEE